MKVLDNIPLASLVFVVGCALTVIAYLNGELTVFEAFAALGFTGVGTGAIGKARADSGKGTR